MLRNSHRRRASVFLMAAACGLALVACGQDTSEVDAAGQDQSMESVETDVTIGPDRELEEASLPNEQRAEFDDAENLFNSTVGVDYVLTFEIVSSATAEAGPIRVEVVNGRATNIIYPDAVTEQILPQIPLLKVSDFFERARTVLAAGGSVEVEFDEAYGFPVTMTLDPIPNAVDDEMSIIVRSVDPVESSVEADGY